MFCSIHISWSSFQIYKKKKTMIKIIIQQSCFFYILLLLVYLVSRVYLKISHVWKNWLMDGAMLS